MPKPAVERLDGREVVFADGSREPVDVFICATGYRISFPFLDTEVASADENRIGLYGKVVHPDHPGLYFIGLIQPLGAIMPLAELQARWVAGLIA
ncbi:MAG: NAD(P)/FAD-dependent oxidoreductase, partial [Actinobacteria bacterium]|nr:NAD(P)/FAD-dependent oxidoreductase [Actinomycetota bacterium]NIT99132.1 NAD(P)/FAD-dependent oxidoreductase [Actinomycetota bacterium]NIV59347.1 NAD(P)/FAD-dependent oxidoreductase [Actinomycetota bacterium]NIX54108.1 NAD(P)/FAD-dependent oxidoreductase [Actinomycetota bacterium]